MVILAERSIESTINKYLAIFRANLSTLVSDVFAQETPANQQEIATWWQSENNVVIAQVGYSLSPVRMPLIAITQEPSQEIANRRFVGNMQFSGSAGSTFGTTFEALYACRVFAPNQNLLLWTQALVQWCLEMGRSDLENLYALLNQRISFDALRPAPDSMKDIVFPFMRTVFLSCQHIDTWTPPGQTSVESASVVFTPS